MKHIENTCYPDAGVCMPWKFNSLFRGQGSVLAGLCEIASAEVATHANMLQRVLRAYPVLEPFFCSRYGSYGSEAI